MCHVAPLIGTRSVLRSWVSGTEVDPSGDRPIIAPQEIEAEIVQLRQELEEQPGQDCGADNVRYYLQQIAQLDDWEALGWRVPSRATINKIMKRHGLVRPEPRKQPNPHTAASPMPGPGAATKSMPPR